MRLEILDLRGAPREMGRQHGEHFREAIGLFARRRLEVCVRRAERAKRDDPEAAVIDFARGTLVYHERYAPAVYDEFLGMAEGAGIAPELLMVGNGLTDIIDVFRTPKRSSAGCTAWLAGPEATADGAPLLGQTWDMHGWAREHVIAVRRQPEDGPKTLAITTTGCLSLVGVNEAGIAAGNNNVVPTDARAGVMYLAMIHHVLSQRTLAGAINAITSAPRLSGHNYYLGDADGGLVDIETTAERFEVITPAGDMYAHTNHYLSRELIELEAGPPKRSTTWRLDRMLHVLHNLAGEITAEAMMRVMADTTGEGDCRICRVDAGDDTPTCAAVVLDPRGGRLRAAKGAPCESEYVSISL